MSMSKIAKDYIEKTLRFGYVPEGVVDWLRYSRDFGGINFSFEEKDGVVVAKSKNFRYGTILTTGKDLDEADRNVRDAILTAFEIPSVYVKEGLITKEGEKHAVTYVGA